MSQAGLSADGSLMPYEWIAAPSFGGGLNFTGHPAALNPHEWTWSQGWLAKDGMAEILPGYVRVTDGSYLSTQNVIGIVQNPFDPVKAALIGAVNTSTGAVALFELSDDGTIVTIPFSGNDTAGGSQAAKGDAFGLLGSAFINGFLVLSYGANLVGGTGSYSVVRLADVTGYDTVKPSTTLHPTFLTAFQNHAIAVGTGFASSDADARTVKVSDAESESIWDPAISNSADEFTLDSPTRIGAVARHQGTTLALLALDRTYLMSPTGGIPPFTVQDYGLHGAHYLIGGSSFGAQRGGIALAGETPFGAMYRGSADFYTVGATTGFGMKVFAFYRLGEPVSSLSTNPMPQMHWHGTRRAVFIPKQVVNTDHSRDVLLFDPVGQAWSRIVLAGASTHDPIRHAVLIDSASGTVAGGYIRHWYVTSDGSVFTEDLTGTATTGAFVDSKDFLISPGMNGYTNRIKVDWEPLTNATTDAIDILAYAHNDLSPAILGSAGQQMDFTSQFVSQGTLPAGSSELPLRLKGKYVRIRFKQNSGRARVRGFALRRRVGGDSR